MAETMEPEKRKRGRPKGSTKKKSEVLPLQYPCPVSGVAINGVKTLLHYMDVRLCRNEHIRIYCPYHAITGWINDPFVVRSIVLSLRKRLVVKRALKNALSDAI